MVLETNKIQLNSNLYHRIAFINIRCAKGKNYSGFRSCSLCSALIFLTKQRKLYHYSVLITFWNLEGEIYAYKVFFDKEETESRPIVLYNKGDYTGLKGYDFTLEDEELEFYNKIIRFIDVFD